MNPSRRFSPFLRCPCQTGLIRRVPLVLIETTAVAPMLAATCILRKATGLRDRRRHRHTRTVPVLLRNLCFGGRSRRVPRALRRDPENNNCEGRRQDPRRRTDRKGRTLNWHSSPERYVAPGVVRQDCIGTVNNYRCKQIKEKIGWHSVYASDGSGRSYFPIESVAGSLPESSAVRH